MGQYYKPICFDNLEYLHAHKLDNGLKLMEHSYIGNNMMNAIEHMLLPEGRWHKLSIVWAGDYADEEKDGGNLYQWADDKCDQLTPTAEAQKPVPSEYKYLLNHDKKLFVDLSKIVPDKYDLRIHPLPLLVAEGNGRGGGDFHGEDARIGTWSRDCISLDKEIPEGFTELDGQFVER